MQSYIKNLIQQNQKSANPSQKKDVIVTLMKNMQGYEKPRDHKEVHASDVTRSDFCARQFILLDLTGKTKEPKFIDSALRATFDMGNDVAARVCNEWAGEDAIGHWKCRACQKVKHWGSKPKSGCSLVEAPCDWQYKEVKFFHQSSQISGSIDLFMGLGQQKATLIELKIIKPEEFEKIVAPLAEHKARTQLYLEIIKGSNSAYKDWIDTTQAKVLYVSRGYGKKNAEVNKIVPFKEFDVMADSEAAAPYLARGMLVHLSRVNSSMPTKKLCDSITCSEAKSCSVRAECFSGEHG